jgi:hypothetical protein
MRLNALLDLSTAFYTSSPLSPSITPLHNSQNIPETRKKKFVENFPEIVWQ